MTSIINDVSNIKVMLKKQPYILLLYTTLYFTLRIFIYSKGLVGQFLPLTVFINNYTHADNISQTITIIKKIGYIFVVKEKTF